jgi:transglutaminase-like putative cysteine protease
MNIRKIFCFLVFLILINNIYAENTFQSNEPLDFTVVNAQHIDVDMNVDMPVYISNYGSEDSFVFRTKGFIDTRFQKVDFEYFYYDSVGNKIYGETEEDEEGNIQVTYTINPVTKTEYVFSAHGNIVSENNVILKNQKYDLSTEITNEIAGEDVEKYMQSTRYIQSSESEILTLAENLKQSDDALLELVNIVNWVNQNIEYDLSYANVMLNSLQVLKNRKGVCNEISTLTAAILRARGFPVRYVTGIANSSEYWAPHAWLEVYVPYQGWISVDPTYNEIALVDASHIVAAYLVDPSFSEDLVSTRSQTISVLFGDKRMSTKTNVQRKFSDVGYKNYINVNIDFPTRLKSGSLLDVEVTLKNTTANTIVVYGSFLVDEEYKLINKRHARQTVLLEPYEDTKINYYYILPNLEYTTYQNLMYYTQFQEYEQFITIGPNERIFNSAFFVKDPFISIDNNNFFIEIDFFNYTEGQKNVVFEFKTQEDTKTEERIIESSTEEKFTFNIENIDVNELFFNITGDYQYSKQIKILSNKEIIVETIVDENINNDDTNTTKEIKNVFEKVDNNKKESSEINIAFVIALLFCFVGLIVFVVIKTNNK